MARSPRPRLKAATPKVVPSPVAADPIPPPSITRATQRRVPPPPPQLPRPKGMPPVAPSRGAPRSDPEEDPVPQETNDEVSGGEEEPQDAAPPASQPMHVSTPNIKTTILGVTSSTSKRLFLEETPDHPIRPSPKFVFLSDQKTVPGDLKRLQETTIKRRRDTVARMHDLECQVAKLLSMYAEETMDLDLATRDTMDRSVCSPLEASAERLAMERESSEQRSPAIVELEQRLAALDQDMTRHIYVTLSDAKRDELDSLHNDVFQQDIIPSMHFEDTKSDKIESGIIRRFENVAGIIARQFHQESAARRASIELVKRQFQKAEQQEHARGDDILQTLQELREKLRRERQARQQEDRKILDDIIRTTVVMKRALLTAVEGGN